MESANSEAAILSRLIEPERSTLAAEAARDILTLKFQESDFRRMSLLSLLGEGICPPP